MKFIKNNLQIISLLSLFLLDIIFISIWFRKPYILAAGESGLFFYNPSYLLHLSQNTWASPALGNPTGLGLLGLPFYFFASLAAKVFPSYLIQAITFAILLGSPIIFFWSYEKRTFHFFAKYIAVLFYMCNIGAMTLIWNRLQYPYIFFYALMPFAFFTFNQAIQQRKFSYLALFLCINFLFSVAFASIPLIILFWLVLGIYMLFLSITNWKQKKLVLFSWEFFVASLVIWVLSNTWWILPFFHSLTHSPYVGTQTYSTSSDTQTFLSLSQNTGDLAYIFRLMHKDFFQTIIPVWGEWYQQPFFTLLSFVVPFLAFSSLLFKKKPVILYFFLFLALLTTFFMKGSSGPFGYISFFLFTHVRILESFRNPFEKFGLILPFAYAPLIGYSFYRYYLLLKQKFSQKILLTGLLISLFFLCGVLVYPMWNGWVFSSTVIPTNNHEIGYYVDPPLDYKRANEWLNQKPGDFRILALPISTEGITNTWKFGYNGVETSNMLFDKPAVSFTTSIQFLENITNQVHSIFFSHPQDMNKFLTFLGVQYFFIRSDINYNDRQLINPSLFTQYVYNHAEDFSLLPFEKAFGDLAFYRNTSYKGLVWGASSAVAASSITPMQDAFTLLQVGKNDVILNTDTDSTHQNSIVNNSDAFLVDPLHIIDYATYPTMSLDDAQRQLPLVQYLPSSKLYPLLRIKENIQKSFTLDSSAKLQLLMTLTNKRLAELIAVAKAENVTSLPFSLQAYTQSLKEIDMHLHALGDGWLSQDSASLYVFQSAFLAQKILLDNQKLHESAFIKKYLEKASNSLAEFSLQNNISPLYTPIVTDTFSKNRHIYSFSVLKDATYSILLKKNQYENYFQEFPQIIPIQIDDTLEQVKNTDNTEWIYLTDISLKKGYHEIQIPLPVQKNLIDTTYENKDLVISSNDKTKALTIPFTNFDPHGIYHISFEYEIQKGHQMKVIVEGGLDPDNKQVPIYAKDYVTDIYDHGYQQVSFEYTPSKNTFNQQLVFEVAPFNNCHQLYEKNVIYSYRCSTDKIFSLAYDRPTILSVRNVHIEKEFTNSLYLVTRRATLPQNAPLPDVSSQKLSSSEYKVTIRNAQNPFYLVLSESYHPLWKARIQSSSTPIGESSHFLVNSYANAWLVNKKGSYTIMITYTSEQWMLLGRIIALCVGIIVIVLSLISVLRKKQ